MEKAGIYIRMSTDDQPDSPARQLSQVRPYCEKKGYHVAGVYQDLGMRGSDNQRPNFQRLMDDARHGRIDVIVVDEQSRLSRNDPLEFQAKIAYPLRQAGVALDVVAENKRFNWDEDDLSQILVNIISQDKASKESRDLGRRTITGMAEKAKESCLFVGRAPFGYRYQLDDDNKQSGYVVGEPEHVATVRRIFSLYVDEDLNIDDIVARLNDEHTPTPSGKGRWGKTTVNNILRRPVYAGRYCWGRTQQGKYYRYQDGEIRRKGREDRGSERRPVEEWEVRNSGHEPIIDPDLFDRAQRMLTANRAHKPRPPRCRRPDAYPLSGLLTCSACGQPMYGTEIRSGGRPVAVYRCGSYMSNGACAPRTVWQSVIYGKLAAVLREKFLRPENLYRLRAALERHQTDRKAEEALRAMIAQTEGKIAKIKRNIALLEPDEIAAARDTIRELERQKADAQGQLNQSGPFDVERLIGRVNTLAECLATAKPNVVRALLRETIGEVVIRTETVQKKKVARYPLAGGIIRFRKCEDQSHSEIVSICTSRFRACPSRSCRHRPTAPPVPSCVSR